MSSRPVRPDITFKPGSGITFKSADDDFAMSLGLRAQFRYTYDNAEAEQAEQSFQIRRARITWKGHVFGEHNKYKLELAVSPRDVAVTQGAPTQSPLLDLYFDFDHIRDLGVRIGQSKVPFNRQRVISSGDLQLVDRATTNGEFTVDRDVGIDVRSMDFLGLGLLRYYAGVYTGQGRDAFEAKDFELMYLGRVEVLPFGLFDDYTEPDFARTGPRLSLGAAFAYVDNAANDRGILGARPEDGGTTDFEIFNADALLHAFGFSAFTEFFWRSGERESGPLVDDMGDPILDEDGNPITTSPTRDGLGLMAQLGYLIPRLPLEIAARYAFLRGRETSGHDALDDEDEIGGGLGYYFAHHQLKLQTDYFRLVRDGDVAGGTDEFRIQLQAAY